MCPSSNKLVKISPTISVGAASVVRSFSQMKMIKISLQKRLRDINFSYLKTAVRIENKKHISLSFVCFILYLAVSLSLSYLLSFYIVLPGVKIMGPTVCINSCRGKYHFQQGQNTPTAPPKKNLQVFSSKDQTFR